MPFQPHVDQVLLVERVPYRIAAHPSAPGMVYGQEGRQGIVYQLLSEDGTKKALKAFKPRFRVPALASLSERLGAWAGLEGLQVCRRAVLTPQRHAGLLREHPDLTYAVLMPWVEGATWMEVLLGGRALTPEESLALARGLAGVLAGMEQEGVAHCDLSGPNVLVLPSQGGGVALVDVEQLYAPDLRRPVALPGGSPGYAHNTAPDGLWAAEADRFAGAVLIAEMLGWCDERVREVAWGESYFDPAEVQSEGRRYGVLAGVLRERWGGAAVALFERAWRSDTLSDCATFGEWLLALPEQVGAVVVAAPPAVSLQQEQAPEREVEQPLAAPAPEADLHAARELITLGQQLAAVGEHQSALRCYDRALALAGGSTLAQEVALLIAELEAKMAAPAVAAPESDDVELARLFDEGATACERGEWPRGAELLAEVVRRRPGYERGGKRAQALLERAQAWVQRQGKSEPRPRDRVGLAVLAGCGVLALALLAGGAAVSKQRAQAAATRTADALALLHENATPAAASVPATALPTDTPRPTMTATATGTPVPSPTLTPAPSATAVPASPTAAPAPPASLGLMLAPGVKLELVRVPAGEFTMGSSDSDADAFANEKPQHTVYLDEYYMGRYEVTVAQFRAFINATGYAADSTSLPSGKDEYPVAWVSWDDAVAFCAWASEVTGRRVRLPTEAEWEKAARGTDGRRYPWGDDAPSDVLCNYNRNVGDTAPVGSYPAGANPYGALDMAGNVWEWTSSLYRPYPYAAGDGREDVASRDLRVLRGGAFNNSAGVVRAANRDWDFPVDRFDSLGFRVCVSPI